MNFNKIEFPKPAWKKLYSDLNGYNLKNKYYYDEVFKDDNYQYEFNFNYNNIKAKFSALDFTYNHGNAGVITSDNKYNLTISFEYKVDPEVEIHLYKKNIFFKLLSKLMFKNVPLNNTQLESRYNFESNKPKLARTMIKDLNFLNEEIVNSFISNKDIDYNSGNFNLTLTSNKWIEDYDEIKTNIESMFKIYNKSLRLEFQNNMK